MAKIPKHAVLLFPNFTAASDIFNFFDRAAHRCFTNTIGQANMKFSSIFSPVHQSQQQLIGSAQFRWSPEVSQPFFDDCEHLFEGFALDTR